MNSYQKLLTLELVTEKPQTYLHLTERHIQAIWFEQKYFKNLKTIDGEEIEILSPGIWNVEAGPDFQKAHLRIGDKEYRGDIELHLQADSWSKHRHQKDKRYNNVILHISFWQKIAPVQIATENDTLIKQAYLEPFLTIPLTRILQLIDLDLYPYKKFLGSGSCSRDVFGNLPESKVASFFHQAAEWRFSQKRAYLQSFFSDPCMQFGGGFARALGYKNNSHAFFELFRCLSQFSLNEKEYLALGMQLCGFFEEPYISKWHSSEAYQHLKNLQKSSENLPNFKLFLNQIRPLNHPVRRLALLAKFLAQNHHHQLYLTIVSFWNSTWAATKKWKGFLTEFLQLFPSFEDDYWNHHYTFENNLSKKHLSLLGSDLKMEILMNVFLPLLQGEILHRMNAQEIAAFHQLCLALPNADTSKLRYLIHRFFGDTLKGNLLKTAALAQGAYQLHQDFCVHYEASCEGCPFVARFKSTY